MTTSDTITHYNAEGNVVERRELTSKKKMVLHLTEAQQQDKLLMWQIENYLGANYDIEIKIAREYNIEVM